MGKHTLHPFVCKNCGKFGYIEQWLVDEKITDGQHLFCSHSCGKQYYHDHPEEHPHTKKMLKQILAGY